MTQNFQLTCTPPRPRSLTFVQASVRCVFLFLATLVACCALPEPPDSLRRDRFGIRTEEGVVLAVVKGAAIGVTNTKLARLIRAGVATAYPLQCYKQSDEVAADRLMVWKVTNIGIRQTAVISVAVIQRGNIVASVFKHVPAPGYNTDGMFMLDVSSLARKVLPPPATPMTSQPGNCS